jgi:demethylmenaquinone methyltransferase / 2-methoxy-6-polyprenyl-1,4-benzoquinol methylase
MNKDPISACPGASRSVNRYSGEIAARRYFAGTASSYDRCVLLWTLGLDRWWKQRIIREISSDAARVLDQACGTGILTLRIARKIPRGQVFGVDLHREYIVLARQKMQDHGIRNVDFILGRAEDTTFLHPVDCITSSYLGKYADLDSLIENAADLLREGGKWIMHDFTYPKSRIFSAALIPYFRIMQTIGERWFPEWHTAFHELLNYLKNSDWTQRIAPVLRRNGFFDIRAQSLTFGIAAIVTATRGGCCS